MVNIMIIIIIIIIIIILIRIIIIMMIIKPAGMMWKVQGWSCPPREFVAQHKIVPG